MIPAVSLPSYTLACYDGYCARVGPSISKFRIQLVLVCAYSRARSRPFRGRVAGVSCLVASLPSFISVSRSRELFRGELPSRIGFFWEPIHGFTICYVANYTRRFPRIFLSCGHRPDRLAYFAESSTRPDSFRSNLPLLILAAGGRSEDQCCAGVADCTFADCRSLSLPMQHVIPAVLTVCRGRSLV